MHRAKNDAAAAMVVADERWAAEHSLNRLLASSPYGIAAVEPGMFGLVQSGSAAGA